MGALTWVGSVVPVGGREGLSPEPEGCYMRDRRQELRSNVM